MTGQGSVIGLPEQPADFKVIFQFERLHCLELRVEERPRMARPAAVGSLTPQGHLESTTHLR